MRLTTIITLLLDNSIMMEIHTIFLSSSLV